MMVSSNSAGSRDHVGPFVFGGCRHQHEVCCASLATIAFTALVERSVDIHHGDACLHHLCSVERQAEQPRASLALVSFTAKAS
jgi:hypothetical protein